MKIGEIIRDIEYLQPKGIKDCKTGWSQEEVDRRVSPQPESLSEGNTIAEVDFKPLREQLSREGSSRIPNLPKEVEVIGR